MCTGASSGIGRATALTLAKRGMKLVLADIDEADLATTHKECAALCCKDHVLSRVTDVRKFDDLVALKEL